MIRCCKCKEERDAKEFNYKNRKLNLRAKACKECTRQAVRLHYKENKAYYLKKAKSRNEKLRKENQKLIYKFLSEHCCVDCGETDPIVLEFDHIKNKSENVSEMLKWRYSKEKLIEEIKKCEIRCANCHRRKTAKDYNWYKHLNMHP